MGIKFFKKNIYDLSNPYPVTTVTDSVATDTGEDFTDLMRNRLDTSGWSTTDSSDSGNTTIEIDFIDTKEFSDVLILNHNLKSFTLKYWNGSAWTDFSTAISETTNTLTSNHYSFTKVNTDKIQMIITGTQTADDDKTIRQLIFTESLGEFDCELYIKPVITRSRQSTTFLSGKTFVSRSSGGFKCTLEAPSVFTDNDLTLVETIFDSYNGVLMWLSGGTTSQYETLRQAYRLQDIYLVTCSNEYEPEWNEGRYKNGMKVKMDLVEIN